MPNWIVRACRKCGQLRTRPLRYLSNEPVCQTCYEGRPVYKPAPEGRRCEWPEGCTKHRKMQVGDLWMCYRHAREAHGLGRNALLAPIPPAPAPEPVVTPPAPKRPTFVYREPGCPPVVCEVVWPIYPERSTP